MEDHNNKQKKAERKDSQVRDSDFEDDTWSLNEDDWYPIESWEFAGDNENGINPDCNESQMFRGDEFPADEEVEHKSSIFERPVFGRFGYLYWLKIQVWLVFWRFRRFIEDKVAGAEPDTKEFNDFPF